MAVSLEKAYSPMQDGENCRLLRPFSDRFDVETRHFDPSAWISLAAHDGTGFIDTLNKFSEIFVFQLDPSLTNLDRTVFCSDVGSTS